MNELKFNSQVCTTKEQSQRLLDLGLKPETADMVYEYEGTYPYDCNLRILEDGDYISSNIITEDIPAWSLQRLFEMICNKECDKYYYFDFSMDYDSMMDVYDSIIEVIERHIKNKFFNKEYLKQ